MKAKNVLIIDDNEIDIFIARQVLLNENAAENITVQLSAMDALKFLFDVCNEPDKIPDYIFLDIRMPEMDGFDFLEKYSQFPDIIKNKCIICMLTSSRDSIDAQKAAQYPFVKKFISKPLDRAILKDL